ncbi:uncharacterized protein LOC144157745 [Haemaphysalis longicornis]
MPSLPWAVFAHYLFLCLTASSSEGKEEHRLAHEVVNPTKVYENFPAVEVIFDQDQDGDLDCALNKRIDYDVTTNTATYVWYLRGGNSGESRNITFHMKPGPTPDTAIFTTDDDETTENVARFIYTDYKNCVVGEIPFNGNLECMLWVPAEVKNRVPQKCIDMFEDNCDEKISAYSVDLCNEEKNM